MIKNIPPEIFDEKILAHYPDEICHLNWNREKPWTLLFAVILSAQCTDIAVNKATENLFKNFLDLESFVAKPIELIEADIKTISFFRTKAKNLQKSAKKLILEHQGKVPNTMESLIELPGVGRKTANVVLWNVHGKNLGFVVDTHVGRIAQRVGLTKQKTPEKIEKDLMKKLPKEHWGKLSHCLVQFGRDFCQSRRPKCETCFLAEVCPKRELKRALD